MMTQKNAQIRVLEESQLFVQNQYQKKKKLDSHEIRLKSVKTNTSNWILMKVMGQLRSTISFYPPENLCCSIYKM
jgi:hypothetical protein